MTVSGVDLVAREARFPRLVALILDSIFVSLITLVVTNVYGVTVVTWGNPVPTEGFASWGTDTTVPGIWTIALWLAYYIVFEGMFSATPGKALNGLRVVSTNGRPLTLRSIVIRNVLRPVDALPFLYLIGGVAVFATPVSQRVGDMAAGTTVVLRRRMIDTSIARSSGRTARLVLAMAIGAAILFTGLFDYFGRPALVIRGAFNQHLLAGSDLLSYQLGTPSRTLTTITYPITGRTSTSTCAGTITLDWSGPFGWQMSSASMLCVPG